ncbi:two-component system phosphate regulon sensor histidine kinase PhoR [Breznakibacter xylanolyticus]|uniref:histidine kinase n=1 Tax=Breznakibacter xylanolyticus TaxID=990 RepID=A0A2W7NZT0_9BACT|nr:HAMP domain-containing sensor histidine kinase [Breznakibacter xylanolyticus]PZX16722.1 two-component system phosphate regulon sensor histidine kinase PhoR [Breznakibacter xylanolyticus]
MSNLSDKQLLKELRDRLEERKNFDTEIKDLSRELQEVTRRLKESEALKSHFISNISNEIINPFTSILGLSKSILSVEKHDWKKVVSMVALIHSEAFTLDFQLRNIFVAAKIEAGEIQPNITKVNIRSLIQNVIDSFNIVSRKMNIDIDLQFNIEYGFGKNFYFKTDSEKLKLIVSNLVNNALKYSYKESKIIVTVWMDEEILNMTVQDYGTGISEKNQKVIFERFKRLDSGINSINRGHGLGLSITKALLDVLGGSIEIQSKKGEGSTFSVTLPEARNIVDGFSGDGNDIFFDEGDEIF